MTRFLMPTKFHFPSIGPDRAGLGEIEVSQIGCGPSLSPCVPVPVPVPAIFTRPSILTNDTGYNGTKSLPLFSPIQMIGGKGE